VHLKLWMTLELEGEELKDALDKIAKINQLLVAIG
jgi:hypothetical protein